MRRGERRACRVPAMHRKEGWRQEGCKPSRMHGAWDAAGLRGACHNTKVMRASRPPCTNISPRN